MKQQAADRIKARADAQPQKRPPIAPQLSKLPQIRFDVVFDQDSSLIRPASYQTIGSIADALTDPKLRPYRYLIVDHVESAGRRDHNLILSQRRAESIRDVLVNTFKVSPKRLQALGLGEEQLQDVNRPAVSGQCARPAHCDGEGRNRRAASRQRRLRRRKKAPRGKEKKALTFCGWVSAESPTSDAGPGEEHPMSHQTLPAMAGLILGLAIMMTTPATADALKDEIAPTGKLRVAIAISPAGGAFWSTKTETGYAGVPVDLGKAMAEQLGVPVEFVAHNNSGQIVDAVSKSTWDITFLPKDPEREGRMSFGPIYEVADATYIVKPGSRSRISQRSISPGSRSPRSTTPPRCAARLRI